MSDLSFQTSDFKMTISKPQKIQPYDRDLKFNQVIHTDSTRPTSVINSINPVEIRDAVRANKTDDLRKITLAGVSSKNETGLWDVMFNSVRYNALTACVFLANSKFKPIHLSRVSYCSQFLNYSMSTSRVHLNLVHPNDKIGIGIYDLQKSLFYVLIYNVDDFTFAPHNTDSVQEFLLSAVNCSLEHIYRINSNGAAEFIDFVGEESGDREHLLTFVQSITTSINNIDDAYPYKPHFLPVKDVEFNYEDMINRIKTETADPANYSRGYEDFINEARAIYREIRQQKNYSKKRNDGKTRKFFVPRIEVVTYPTKSEQEFYVRIISDERSVRDMTFNFDTSEMGDSYITEYFLTNTDIANFNLDEIGYVMTFSEEALGREGFVRHFTVNF